MIMRVVCPFCQADRTLDQLVLRMAKRNGVKKVTVTCWYCEKEYDPYENREKTGPTDSQKRSRKQEKRAAKRYGGSRQPASGARSGIKGDVRKQGSLRLECKFTRAKSFTLKLEELMKIENEAGPGEDPAFEIEFQGVFPNRRYVVVPSWVYERIFDEKETG